MIFLTCLATFWITGYLWSLLFFWFTCKDIYSSWFIIEAFFYLLLIWPLIIPVIIYQKKTYGPFNCWSIDP